MRRLGVGTFWTTSKKSLRGRSRKKSLNDLENIREKNVQNHSAPFLLPPLPFGDVDEDTFDHISAFEAEDAPIPTEPRPPEAKPHQNAINMEITTTMGSSHIEYSPTEEVSTAQAYPQELPRPPEEDAPLQPLLDPDLMIAKEKLVEQQRDVSAKRSQVRGSRLALRYKREEETKLRIRLIRQLDSLKGDSSLSSHQLPGDLVQDLELLRTATHEYLAMEQRYHQEEDQLEEQEYLLTQSMESFASPSERDALQDTQGFIGPLNQNPESDPMQDTPRCVVNYLSRIGDERILQERLSDLETEWFLAIEKREQRSQLRLEPDELSEEFIRTFDSHWMSARKELNIAQLDVNELRIICVEHGYKGFEYEDLSALRPYAEDLFPQPDEGPLKLLDEEPFFFDEKAEEAAHCPENLHHSSQDSDSLKQSPVKSVFFYRELEKVEKFGSANFVNKWMLHQLRISSMGIWQLQLLLDWRTRRDEGWQDRDIREHALKNWYEDEAGKSQPPEPSYIDYDGPPADPLEHFVSPSLRSLPNSIRSLRPRRNSLTI